MGYVFLDGLISTKHTRKKLIEQIEINVLENYHNSSGAAITGIDIRVLRLLTAGVSPGVTVKYVWDKSGKRSIVIMRDDRY